MDAAASEPVDEARLAARIAAGDESALAMAYDRYAPLLFGAILRFSGDRERAAEVVQDAFLSLWRRAGQFDPASGPLAGWLLAIARHRAIDHFRAESRRPLAGAQPLPAHEATGPADDPTEIAERHWAQSVVRSCVAQLPAAEREMIALAYASGLSQAEIASRTGLPLGTVKSRTRRALARLRPLLAGVPGVAGGDRQASPARRLG